MAAARTCDLCGHANAETVATCGVCGNELPAVVVPLAQRVGWVCDGCDAWNLERSARCSFCGEGLEGDASARPAGPQSSVSAVASFDTDPTESAVTPIPPNEETPTIASSSVIPAPEPTRADSRPGAAAGPSVCFACGTPTIPNNRFCGNCGVPLSAVAEPAHAKGSSAPAVTASVGRKVAKRAELVLVQTDGTDGAHFEVGAAPQIVGRTEGSILFPDDRLLSGRHASLSLVGDLLVVEDLGSANGTFVRLTAAHPLVGGDAILLGEQLLLFRCPVAIQPPRPDSAGTVPYASTVAPAAFHLVQMMAGGRAGTVFTPVATRVTIGREASDICFPNDRFLSSRHARIEPTGNGFQLVDLQSRNGTYVRIRERASVRPGETIFLGQQLFRFVLPGA